MTNSAAEELLQQEARRLLADLNFTAAQADEIVKAYCAKPEGVERCILEAKAFAQRQGRPAAGLLLTMIRRNDHLLEADPTTKRITGWRWVYGAGHAAGTYVQDPVGTDPLPPGYDLLTRNPVVERAEREKDEGRV
jgi:hypothetical protein